MTETKGDNKAAREAVARAISALKSRGDDVNPYSVADEAKLSRAELVRSTDLMSLIGAAREGGNGHAPAPSSGDATLDELRMQNDAIARELKQLQWENGVLRRYFQDSQAENKKLQDEMLRVQEEAKNIAKTVSVAYQQGYLAGQLASGQIGSGSKNVADDLAQAARAVQAAKAQAANVGETAAAVATAGGATAVTTKPAPAVSQSAITPVKPMPALKPAEAPAATAKPAAAPAPAVAPAPAPLSAAAPKPAPQDEPAAAVLASTLHIEDPEVLNDPFTAKLLSALQAETEDVEVMTEEEAQQILAAAAAQETSAAASAPAAAPAPAAAQPEPAPEAEDPAEDLADIQAALEQASKTPATPDLDTPGATRYTAEDLHNLFRQKYVKGEEPAAPPEQPAPAAGKTLDTSQPTKKFVGTKHSAADPLPTMPRVFPPEIRKACKLLGLNPEELSRATVIESWKREMSKPGVHPDTGGDTEMAIYLNTAKDTLMRWVEDQTPKLGKKFGQGHKAPEQTQKPPAKPE